MKDTISTRRDEIQEALTQTKLGAEAKVRETFQLRPETISNKHAQLKIAAAIQDVLAIGPNIGDDFKRLRVDALSWLEGHRYFIVQRKLKHDARMPNTDNTLISLFVAGGIETVVGAWMYAIDRKLTFMQGLGYSGLFSSLTVLLGVGFGYTALRYGAQSYSYSDTGNVKTVRRLAWAGGAVITGLFCVLAYSAARVRTMPLDRDVPRNEDIWNFQDLGVWAPFSDAYTLILLILALVTYAISVAKGAHGFSDFVPGYSASYKKVERIERIAQDQADDYDALIDERRDNAIDDFEDDLSQLDAFDDYSEARADAIDEVTQHNADVMLAQVEMKDLEGEHRSIYLNKSVFESDLGAWLIDINVVEQTLAPVTPPSAHTEDLVAKLNNECEVLKSSVRAALLSFRAAIATPSSDGGEV